MAVRDVVMAAAGVGGASPTFVALASNHTQSASLVINKPTGTIEGDLMLAVLNGTQGTNDATFASSGWSVLYQFDNGTNSTQGVLYKVAGASEGSSYTFTNTAAIVGSIVTYRNAAIGLYTNYVTDAAGVATVTGMTIPTNGCLFMAFFGDKDSGALTTPSGMTSVVSNTGTGAYNLCSEYRDAGATGTRSNTDTGMGQYSAFSFFLTPSSFVAPIGPFPIGQSTTQTTTNGTSLVINKPTGTREGDLMIAYLLGSGGTQSSPGFSGDTGWTYAVNLHSVGTTGRPFNAIAYKVAGASEGASYTFTATTSRTLAGTIVTYRNAAYDASGANTSGATPLVVTAVTATENYSRVIGIAGRDTASVTITGPTGMTALVTQNDGFAPSWIIEQDDALIPAGSSGTRSFGMGNSTNVNGILHTIKNAASYTKYATYNTSASGFGTSGTSSVSAAVTYPAEIIAGRVIVLAAAAFGRGDAPTITLPAGFTQLASFTSSASGEPAVLVAYKVADGTEGGTQLNVAGTPGTGGGLAAAVVVAIAAETPSVGSVGTGSATTTVTANSITATQNDLLIFVGALDLGQSAGTASFTPPAGYTEIVDVFADAGGSQQDGAFVVAYKEGSSAGATGSVTATATAAGGTKGVLIRVPGK